jgi:hypothetical protein
MDHQVFQVLKDTVNINQISLYSFSFLILYLDGGSGLPGRLGIFFTA